MSNIVGLICGSQLVAALPQALMQKGTGVFDITDNTVFTTIEEFEDELMTITPSVIDSWGRIILLDTAFSNGSDTKESVREFLGLQDVMKSVQLKEVRLNLLTNNSDVYTYIQRGIDGYDGIIYPNTEVFYYNGKIKVVDIVRAITGKQDGQGFHLEPKRARTRVEKLDETKRELEERGRLVSDQILEHEKDLPTSQLSQRDIVGTEASKRKQEEYWAKEAGEFEDSTGGKEEVPEIVFGNTQDERKEEIKVSSNVKINQQGTQGLNITEEAKGIDKLNNLYHQLAQDSFTIVDEKLATDKGTSILFTGMKSSGVSGVVAQTAEIYAMMGLKVGIVDLDVDKRMQTVYFPNFDAKIAEGYGLSNGLMATLGGGRIEQASVPVTSRISITGLSRGFAHVNIGEWKQSINRLIEETIPSSIEEGIFDIVLIDCPFKNIKDYVTSLQAVNRMVMVVDNKYYNMEHFLGVELEELVENNDLLLRDTLKKTSIIINKMLPNTRDEKGYVVGEDYVKKMLMDAGVPYDSIFVVGEIPYYEEWEKQFITNKRYVWDDDIFLSVMKDILKKAV